MADYFVDDFDLRRIWAKLGNGKTPHPLLCHAMDTVAVAELLFDVYLGGRARRELLQAFEPLGDARQWVTMLCGLHDLGKCSPAFQAVRADIAVKLLNPRQAVAVRHVARGPGDRIRTDTDHGRITAIRMMDLLSDWGAERPVAREISAALGGHHGSFPLTSELKDARSLRGDLGDAWWERCCHAIVETLATLWGLPDPARLPWNRVTLSMPAAIGLAALTSFSDWVASSIKESGHAGADVDLSDYVDVARTRAKFLVDSIGFHAWRPPMDTGFAALFPGEREPRGIQTAAENLIKDVDEAGALTVSAPTGEGKTKLALQVVASLVRTIPGIDGCYLAMPTRSSSNTTFQVADDMLLRLDDATPLRLLHAMAPSYQEANSSRRFIKLMPREVGIDCREAVSDQKLRDWLSKHRGLLAPLGIGTVDQAFRAVIRSRHVFVKLLGLSSKVVVFDEVHSYDVFMRCRIERLLWWLGRLSVPVVILSATLSTRLQRRLTHHWRAGALGCRPDELPDEGSRSSTYPRLEWATAGNPGKSSAPFKTAPVNRERTVKIPQVPWDERVRWALKQAKRDQTVAMIFNTVGQTTKAWKLLQERVAKLPEAERPVTILLHAKLDNRDAAEVALLAAVGPKGTRPRRLIVVGSPLLEQSIDIDVDVMITTLAPIDRLIQRAGRIRRHRSDEPGEIVMAITGVDEKPRDLTFYGSAKAIPKALLVRTWLRVRNLQSINCPTDVQDLIDEVYDHPATLRCPHKWEVIWRKAEGKLEKEYERDSSEARSDQLPQPRSDMQLTELTRRPGRRNHTRKQQAW